MRKLSLGALLALCTTLHAAGASPAAPPAMAPKVDVKHFTLANGLQVLFVAKHTAPVVSVQVAYHVGSKDEPSGKHGMAHMFEHMMFKGSQHVRPEMHARMLDAVGGTENASTTEDVTIYDNTVPSDQLGFVLKLEAERMRNLLLIPPTVNSEREVVKNERRWRFDDNPGARAFMLMRTSAYRVHPYSWMAIGENKDLDTVTPADCQKFYDQFYQPGNATLVVVGDVEEAEVRKRVEASFGGLPKGPDLKRDYPTEPPQKEYVEKTLKLRVQIPIVVGGYHIPAAGSPDTPALEVLQRILSGGESSRLHQRMVRHDKLAVAAGGFVWPLEHPGLMLIFAAHLPKARGEDVKKALIDEVEQVRQHGVLAKELDKAKNQLLAEHVRKLETVDGIASELARAQYVLGGWQHFLTDLERYRGVTAADVQRVAKQYLSQDSLTLVLLVPGQDEKKPGGGK
ncbi:MAG TPA: pitrilysin family protein [Polyangia bacterium]|nr:pitrilysin family protein [Polyangia bacterium]